MNSMHCWIAHKPPALTAKLTWMIDMNIEQAIKRIAHLNENIQGMGDSRFMLREAEEIFIAVSVGDGRHKPIYMDYSTFSEVIETMIEKNKAEIAKLQPIVDMANAALKGVLS